MRCGSEQRDQNFLGLAGSPRIPSEAQSVKTWQHTLLLKTNSAIELVNGQSSANPDA
jgi:hypothetical protein